MNARIPRLATGLAALAAFVLLPSRASSQEDARRKQEIQMAELQPRVVTDAPSELPGRATSGLPVTFEVIDGPAVMDGKKLRLTGVPGLVILRATQKGNATFLPAVPAERLLIVRARPFAPAIEIQPSPVSAGMGEQAVLSAAAKGEPQPSYQWRRDGMPVSGATGPRLVIATLSPQDAGSYDVVVSNDLGSVTSASVRLSVGKHAQSINFPFQSAVMAGQSLPLNATSTSGLPIEYRLLSGSAVLTSSTLTLQSGTVVVEADQRGDASYEAAVPVIQTFSTIPSPNGTRLP
ncbi:MAG TPA: immunoglobulin domain-containing protein [Opitutaceae bacterium]|jgi:hypothetical protein|nr:immunoglobulin domain-containing protein [Opitutaceae bacterium]